MQACEENKIRQLKNKLRFMKLRIRQLRWEVFCMKYLKPLLKVIVTVLISILAELGVEYWRKS